MSGHAVLLIGGTRDGERSEMQTVAQNGQWLTPKITLKRTKHGAPLEAPL